MTFYKYSTLNNCWTREITENYKTPSSTLVLFTFHEYNVRAKYFLEHCLFDDPMIKFMIICNNETIDFPHPTYVSVIKRPNLGYDFGAWSEGLLRNDTYKSFDYFLFLNSSVVGPYLQKGEPLRSYVRKYTDGLKGDVKLFGSTINTEFDAAKQAHVQSYAFAVDRDTLSFLIQQNIFSLTELSSDYFNTIFTKEKRMSRCIIEKGWNIGCLQKIYRDVDFRFPDGVVPPRLNQYDDTTFPSFQNKLWTNKEVVFIKGKRLGIDPFKADGANRLELPINN